MEHKKIDLGNIHKPHNWEFADAAARAAAVIADSDLIGALALQLDDGTYWRLTSVGPTVWTKAATPNASDAELRDRSTHTGTQAISSVTGLQTALDAAASHTTNTSNPHSVTKAQVGLGNVENKSSADIRSEISSGNVTTALGYTPLAPSAVGDTVASLVAGKVPSSQLPAYVDDVLEYANLAGFPGTGTAGIIYVALDTNKTYRWSGSAYTEISPSPGSTDSVTEGSSNLYFTAARVRDAVLTGLTTVSSAVIAASDSVIGAFQKLQAQITAHTTNTSNPHSVTKAQVGLGSADNTSDADKPISTATQTALDEKFDKAGGRITGNVGLNVSPSAWHANYRSVDSQDWGGYYCSSGGWVGLAANAYTDGTWKYKSGTTALRYEQTLGSTPSHTWDRAVSGSAGAAITWITDMKIDSAGNLLVGATTNIGAGGAHRVSKNAGSTEGESILSVDGGSAMYYSGFFMSAGGGGWNSANAAQWLGKNSVTNRSINAGGTINASGADYAEYERNNGLKFVKGAIVGFDAQGILTNQFSAAIRFGIKSTDPCLVGGDVWGTEDKVGQRPEAPNFTPPEYTGRDKPADLMTESVEQAAQHVIDMAAWQADQAAHAAAVHAARELFDTVTMHAYQRDLAAFEARLEQARQEVDRISYTGKAPCNVLGAAPGAYIVAVDDGQGGIAGIPVVNPSFEQYRLAVGRVNRILPDGRAEVAVIVH